MKKGFYIHYECELGSGSCRTITELNAFNQAISLASKGYTITDIYEYVNDDDCIGYYQDFLRLIKTVYDNHSKFIEE